MVAKSRVRRCIPKLKKLRIVVLCVSVLLFVSHANRREQPPAQPPALSVLVSYVYFETSSQEPCELSNKRTNLAFFIHESVFTSPPGIQFIFNFPGNVPSADVLSHSLGLRVKSEAGVFFTRVFAGQIPNVQLLYSIPSEQVARGASDLCHHWFSLRDRRPEFDFFMLLNDGARGPFTPEASITVSPESEITLLELSGKCCV
jgi:hypothetical protein